MQILDFSIIIFAINTIKSQFQLYLPVQIYSDKLLQSPATPTQERNRTERMERILVIVSRCSRMSL